jgi:hypothetical protein
LPDPPPTYGVDCGRGDPGPSCGSQAYDGDTNPWDAGANACLSFVQPGDSPRAGTAPTNGLVGTGYVFSGNAHVEGIQPVGTQSGFLTGWSWTSTDEIGVTVARYWSTNYPTNGILGQAVKGTEWGEASHPADTEFFVGFQSNGSNTHFPYMGLLWTTSSGCATALASVVTLAGYVECVTDNPGVADIGIRFEATGWTRPGDFFGKWQCISYHIKGIGTSDVQVRVYDQTGALAYGFTGIDAAGLKNQGYDSGGWDIYHNAYGSISEAAATGYDNFHARKGPPVSCASLGFGA